VRSAQRIYPVIERRSRRGWRSRPTPGRRQARRGEASGVSRASVAPIVGWKQLTGGSLTGRTRSAKFDSGPISRTWIDGPGACRRSVNPGARDWSRRKFVRQRRAGLRRWDVVRRANWRAVTVLARGCRSTHDGVGDTPGHEFGALR
jgi:hypothetical protein